MSDRETLINCLLKIEDAARVFALSPTDDARRALTQALAKLDDARSAIDARRKLERGAGV